MTRPGPCQPEDLEGLLAQSSNPNVYKQESCYSIQLTKVGDLSASKKERV